MGNRYCAQNKSTRWTDDIVQAAMSAVLSVVVMFGCILIQGGVWVELIVQVRDIVQCFFRKGLCDARYRAHELAADTTTMFTGCVVSTNGQSESCG